MRPTTYRIGRLVIFLGEMSRRHHPIGCGVPAGRTRWGWDARHVWWRLFWVRRWHRPEYAKLF